jgi:hypothetical protein
MHPLDLLAILGLGATNRPPRVVVSSSAGSSHRDIRELSFFKPSKLGAAQAPIARSCLQMLSGVARSEQYRGNTAVGVIEQVAHGLFEN